MTGHFHSEATVLLNEIVNHVLNDQEVLKNVYKNIDLYQLTHALSNIPHNVLVIGRTTVWLILAKTCHKNHFVGTVRNIRLKPNLQDKLALTRLHDFVYRFATPGSTIATYWL